MLVTVKVRASPRRPPSLIACLAVTGLLASCGHHKPVAETSLDLSPSATPARAGTLAEWTTFIKSNTVDAAATWKTIAHCPVTPAPQDLVCSVGWYTYGGQIEQFGTSLQAAQDPTSTTFLGTPPESIKLLVEQTMAAVKNIEDADHARIQVCPSGKPATPTCRSATQSWDAARKQFQTTIAAWNAYP